MFSNKSIRLLPWHHFAFLLLGAVMLNLFFQNLLLNNYSPIVLQQQLKFLSENNNAPALWNALLLYASTKAVWVADIRFIFELITGVGATLLIARRYIGFAIAIYFLILWISHWAAPGNWAFEYLFPAECALLSSLVTDSNSKKINSWFKEQILGERICVDTFSVRKLLLIILLSALLYYVIRISENAGHLSSLCAVVTASCFGILLILVAVEKWRTAPAIHAMTQDQPMLWVDVMVMSIGSMLVLQLYGDHAIHWFTIKGYHALIENYYQQTSAPLWWRFTLSYSAQHVNILLPLQILFETLSAVCLVLLMARAPLLLFTAIFFSLLTLSEFGVSAKWPVHPGDPRTWTWELLFVTVITYYCALIYLKKGIPRPEWKNFLFGYHYFNMNNFQYIALAVFAGAALTGIGWVTHFFGPAYRVTSILAGISLFILILIQAILRKFKMPIQGVRKVKNQI